MIGEVFDLTPGFSGRLNYIFRNSPFKNPNNKKKDHKKQTPTQINYLGGNVFSYPELALTESGKNCNVSGLLTELEQQANLYLGSGEMKCAHYSISLPAGDSLSPYHWFMSARIFMDRMGYGNDTKWTSVIHNDAHCQHIHIVACRVKLDRTLVNTYNDYDRCIQAVRDIEKILGLVKQKNPNENWGIEYSITDMKTGSGRGTLSAQQDPKNLIRSVLDRVFECRPRTISGLVKKLRGYNVMVAVRRKNGVPTGIMYSVDGLIWISGTHVKRRRAAWGRLLEQGITYSPTRDDKILELRTHNLEEQKIITELQKYNKISPEPNLHLKQTIPIASEVSLNERKHNQKSLTSKCDTYIENFIALVRCTQKQYKKIIGRVKSYIYRDKRFNAHNLLQLNFSCEWKEKPSDSVIEEFLAAITAALKRIFKNGFESVNHGLEPNLPDGYVMDTEAQAPNIVVITSSNQEELVTSIHNANKWIDDWTGRTIPNGIELLKIK